MKRRNARARMRTASANAKRGRISANVPKSPTVAPNAFANGLRYIDASATEKRDHGRLGNGGGRSADVHASDCRCCVCACERARARVSARRNARTRTHTHAHFDATKRARVRTHVESTEDFKLRIAFIVRTHTDLPDNARRTTWRPLVRTPADRGYYPPPRQR